jgi:hypothetical protein
MVSGKLEHLNGGGDTIYGFLVRPFPTQENIAAEGIATSTPNVTLNAIGDVMVKGYMTVVATGTPTKNGQVYFVTSTGVVTATANGGTAITGCYFMGTADSAGNVEISFRMEP